MVRRGLQHKRGVNFTDGRNAKLGARNRTKAAMSDFIPLNTRADAARLADAMSFPSPIPAGEPFAGLEADFLVPLFRRDPQLNNYTPASREFSQQSHSSEDRAMSGSLTSQVSATSWLANN